MNDGYGAYFTVEATFVVTISIWIILGIVYLSLFTHDYCVIYSITENTLSEMTNNGKKYEKSKIEGEIRNKLGSKMMITQVDHVWVEEKLRAIKVEVGYAMNVKLPFVRELVEKIRDTKMEVERHVICPAKDRWNSEIVKGK